MANGRIGNTNGLVHGHTRGRKSTKVHLAWKAMKARCNNKNAHNYSYYGGRGIRVCPEWQDSFEAFLRDMGEPPTPKHELDRYPNRDGNYEPGNCRWATRSQNMMNTRKTHFVTYNGQTKSLTAWANEIGLSNKTLKDRLGKLKWTVERALTTKARNIRR